MTIQSRSIEDRLNPREIRSLRERLRVPAWRGVIVRLRAGAFWLPARILGAIGDELVVRRLGSDRIQLVDPLDRALVRFSWGQLEEEEREDEEERDSCFGSLS